MRTRLVLAVLPVALLGVAVAPSSAAGPKPMKGAYTAAAPVPGGAIECDGTVPGSVHKQEVKLPGAGKLLVNLKGFTGDWDLFVRANGAELSASTSGSIGGAENAVETAAVKIKKATTVSIDSCNWAGGPSGAVDWEFTPAAKK